MSSTALRPTCRMRWRALTEEDDPRQRSILEQLWVSDDAEYGEWRLVDRVPLDADTAVLGDDLRASCSIGVSPVASSQAP